MSLENGTNMYMPVAPVNNGGLAWAVTHGPGSFSFRSLDGATTDGVMAASVETICTLG